MSRILTVFLSLWLAVTPAWACSVLLCGAGGSGAGGGLPIYTYLGFSNQSNVGSSITFSSFNFGTAAANRTIAVLIFTSTLPTITGVTIGGVTATQATGAGGATLSTSSDLWYAAVPAGTTGNIVITFSVSATNEVSIAVAAIGTSTPTPGTGANFQQSFGSTANTTVTIPASGVAFSGILIQSGATLSGFSNLALDDSQVGVGVSGGSYYIGHQTVTGLDTATLTASQRASMTTVPWGP